MSNLGGLPDSYKQYQKDSELSGLLELTDDDAFRWLHYHGGFQSHHASDVDLVCLDAEPEPHVSAFIEFKSKNESASFPQAVLFEALSDVAPVYVVRSQQRLIDSPPDEHRFDIERFVSSAAASEGWIETAKVKSDIRWGGHISGVGNLDDEYHSGLFHWEDEHRKRAKRFGGNGWAAVNPELISAWSGPSQTIRHPEEAKE